MRRILLFLSLAFFNSPVFIKAQSLYFPPLNSSSNWDTISPASLGWCTNQLDSLYSFLQQKNSKGFIVLKDGKIVLEKYFGTFTKDSLWYWASAGKTITSLLIGKAQEENFLKITDTTSDYLNVGWTNCTLAQENKISIRNQLTMTSGLDDGVPDNHCTTDTCLIYKADAGTRWAYHNAPYTLLEGVITAATGTSINVYTQSKLKIKTGMNGFWLTTGYDNVYYSSARSMARFGLLAQNKFIWSNDTLLKDVNYVNQSTSTSQNLNLSYGYLWWLNGKSSYMVPTSQFIIPGSLAPHAPADMFAGIGKNGQIVSVSKSEGIVMIRMGNPPNTSNEVPTQFCDQIWEKLNAVICNPSSLEQIDLPVNKLLIYPNPIENTLQFNRTLTNEDQIRIFNLIGQCLITSEKGHVPDISNLAAGVYFLTLSNQNGSFKCKFIKN